MPGNFTWNVHRGWSQLGISCNKFPHRRTYQNKNLKAVFFKIMHLGIKDPLLTMTLCVPNEKQDKGNLGQKGLLDNTKVNFGATKDHG